MRAPGRGRLDGQLLSDLWVLLAVGREGGMAAAGRRLGISQGAVSQRVARLEARLARNLLTRGRTGVEPTADGAALLAAMADAADRLGDALAAIAPAPHRALVVNCSPSIAQDWLVGALPSLERAHPDISVEVRADQAPVDRARLEREEVDVAIRYEPVPLAGLCELAAVAESTFAVAAPGYVDAAGERMTRLHDATPWLGADADAEWRAWLAAAPGCATTGADRRFNLASLAYDAAEAGQGVAIARAALVRQRLATRRLVPLAPVVPGAAYRFAAARPPALRCQVARFIRWAEAHLAAAVADGLAAAGRIGPR